MSNTSLNFFKYNISEQDLEEEHFYKKNLAVEIIFLS